MPTTPSPSVQDCPSERNLVSDDCSLYALDASSGKKIWSSLTGGPVRSSPTVVNDVVYVGSDDCSLYAFDAISGQKIWQPYVTRAPVRSSPAIVNDVVYVGSDDCNLYAIFA